MSTHVLGFQSFFQVFASFLLAKLAIRNIRVNTFPPHSGRKLSVLCRNIFLGKASLKKYFKCQSELGIGIFKMFTIQYNIDISLIIQYLNNILTIFTSTLQNHGLWSMFE